MEMVPAESSKIAISKTGVSHNRHAFLGIFCCQSFISDVKLRMPFSQFQANVVHFCSWWWGL